MNNTTRKIYIIFLSFFVTTFIAKSQHLNINNCDKSVLSDAEYERCLSDSAWDRDITIRINYISFLKTEVLPPIRKERKKLLLQDTLRNLIIELKNTYDSIYTKRFILYREQMDKNQKFVQPKAYLSSILSFEVFFLYPDIYAVIINDPVTNSMQSDYDLFVDQFYQRCLHAYSLLNEDITKNILIQTTKLEDQLGSKNEFKNLTVIKNPMQGVFENKLEVLNYLLWTE